MEHTISGSVVLITGASSGIGAATAMSLAASGAKVALVARRQDRLDDLAAAISAHGGEALTVVSDITDAAQAAAAVQQTVERFGRLDTVVNNAGVMLLGAIDGAPLDEWDRMLAINLQGLLYVTHAALPHLLRAAAGPRGVADIVNVSSVAGRISRPNMAVYNLTKHGVGAFSEALRQEVAQRHVRVCLVEPGPVATELATHIRPEVMAALMSAFKDATLLTADDVAESIEFVLSRPPRVVINELLIRPDASVM